MLSSFPRRRHHQWTTRSWAASRPVKHHPRTWPPATIDWPWETQRWLEIEASSLPRTRSERCWIPKNHEEFHSLVSSPLFKYAWSCIHEANMSRWFIVTMSTGVISILLHRLPYNGHWLEIISSIFFVLNLVLFLLFLSISCLRYILYPRIFAAVLRHPHQSLFLATCPVGLATLINMTILVCVPSWGHGMAIFAWVLVLALTTCFHLTFVM